MPPCIVVGEWRRAAATTTVRRACSGFVETSSMAYHRAQHPKSPAEDPGLIANGLIATPPHKAAAEQANPGDEPVQFPRERSPINRENLRRELLRRGLTNGEFAARAGVSAMTVSHALSGRRLHPSTIRAFARALTNTPPIPGVDAFALQAS